jgi:hypothetical protein
VTLQLPEFVEPVNNGQARPGPRPELSSSSQLGQPLVPLSEKDRTLRAVLVGMLREDEKPQRRGHRDGNRHRYLWTSLGRSRDGHGRFRALLGAGDKEVRQVRKLFPF